MNKGERTNKGNAVMTQQVKENEPKFPAGIKVLVVDDDKTCLIWVENLLLTCNFKVTMTLYAREAIEMLRQNKHEFDLVITDVQMPEINGFQLLEIIGLEMDLPVIMMSVYSHRDYVKQGVLHGAVDYLVKPVRIQEIQNVWQHVLRKRKDLIREKRAAIQTKSIQGGVDGTLADSAAGAGEASSKKRRDQPKDDDDGYEEEDDSGHDNDEANPNKKPRFVWSPALHQKFVAAVNHLEAVPKKILDIVDVDNITRENIASHLQKYRLYLKKAM